MSAGVEIWCPKGEAKYNGLRLSAAEYFELEEDGCRYELIDGVVWMSPSPVGVHQFVVSEIVGQMAVYLKKNQLGRVASDFDVYLGKGRRGGDLVYRPDVLFIRAENVRRGMKRVEVPPDLVVEIISIVSRRYDQETKKADYERFGVHEYWVLDPERASMNFYRLQAGHYVEIPPEGNIFRSEAVLGFELDLSEIREVFKLA